MSSAAITELEQLISDMRATPPPKLGHRAKTKLYVSILAVTGSGPFPFDMLRRDRCFPLSEDDAFMVGYDRDDKTRIVQLVRFSEDGTGATRARWQSFGWEVVFEHPRGRSR